MTKRLVALTAAIAVVALVAGCNTIEGVGKDVKAAGSSVEKAAAKNKAY
jgi:predicted small secreted protein